jgi:hypothetical protein
VRQGVAQNDTCRHTATLSGLKGVDLVPISGKGILRVMQTLIFNFKTKTVGVVGSPATRRALAEIVAAQRKIIATATSARAQVRR